ncbi:MAG: IS3 family transposase [Gemmataceae bacterium]
MLDAIFAIIKRELNLRSIHTREQSIKKIFEFIECFYKRKRIHSTLGHISPKEYEFK